MKKGVFKTKRKDNTTVYRVSITKNGKHISLGTYLTEDEASKCYNEAYELLNNNNLKISDYKGSMLISYQKYLSLINFRDNKLYIQTPIYLRKNYFEYHLDRNTILKFDRDDLFFYSKHKISKRGNHLFYSEYGMQINLLEKYGIPSYSVEGKDYHFINSDIYDFRYSNIDIINQYHGVKKCVKNGKTTYISKIHVNGYIKIGEYNSEIKAAIAYNKAADILKKTTNINYIQNFPEVSPKEYASIYSELKISDKIYEINK